MPVHRSLIYRGLKRCGTQHPHYSRPPVRLADWATEIGHEKPKTSRDLINMLGEFSGTCTPKPDWS